METFQDLFEEALGDIYYAEKAVLKVLPKMAKKASSEDSQPHSLHTMSRLSNRLFAWSGSSSASAKRRVARSAPPSTAFLRRGGS